MIEYISLAILFIFLAISSIYDIKKRYVPHMLTYGLIFVSISFNLILSFIKRDFMLIFASLVSFVICYAFGWIMFRIKAWGGADVRILAGIGAMIPIYPLSFLKVFSPYLDMPFIFILIWNSLVFGLVFGLIYKLLFRPKTIPFVPSFLLSVPITLVFGNITVNLIHHLAYSILA